jgi:hypothetical protein
LDNVDATDIELELAFVDEARQGRARSCNYNYEGIPDPAA